MNVALELVKKEKYYLLWLAFTIFFGLFNIFACLCLGDFLGIKDALSQGQIYLFSISICTPGCLSMLLEFIIDKKKGLTTALVQKKIISGIFLLVWIIILALIWVGKFKSNIFAQIITGIISLVIAFYVFCLLEIRNFTILQKQFDDVPYLDEEKENISSINCKAKKLKHSDDGVNYE